MDFEAAWAAVVAGSRAAAATGINQDAQRDAAPRSTCGAGSATRVPPAGASAEAQRGPYASQAPAPGTSPPPPRPLAADSGAPGPAQQAAAALRQLSGLSTGAPDRAPSFCRWAFDGAD